jgi:hypothetical protein
MSDKFLARSSKTHNAATVYPTDASPRPFPACRLSPTLEMQMSDRGNPFVGPAPVPDPDYGIVMQAYLQLPLFTRQGNGSWAARLKTFQACELRLVESVPAAFGGPVLRVELFDPRSQSVIESRPCEELEDAVAVFKAMVPIAEAYAGIPCSAKWPEAP